MSLSLPLAPMPILVLVLFAGWFAAPAGVARSAPERGLAGQSASPPGSVRIPADQDEANVHMGPSSGQPVLVLVPAGTVLPLRGRRGEWLEIELDPSLRRTGRPMRWYRNENRGYVHQSAAEIAEPARGGER